MVSSIVVPHLVGTMDLNEFIDQLQGAILNIKQRIAEILLSTVVSAGD